MTATDADVEAVARAVVNAAYGEGCPMEERDREEARAVIAALRALGWTPPPAAAPDLAEGG